MTSAVRPRPIPRPTNRTMLSSSSGFWAAGEDEGEGDAAVGEGDAVVLAGCGEGDAVTLVG